MRQQHRAGEKCFVDFSGDGLEVMDPTTGEVKIAKLFVAVLGASSMTYVEPVFTEDLASWVGCHVRAFEYFGGVSEIVVPDNLKSGVTRVHRYEPELNPTYSDLAGHYGFAIIPARPRRRATRRRSRRPCWSPSGGSSRCSGTESSARFGRSRRRCNLCWRALNARRMRHLGKSRRSSSTRWNEKRSSPSRAWRSNSSTGGRRGFTSTTTSSSKATGTACRTSGSGSAWTCGSTPRRWR